MKIAIKDSNLLIDLEVAGLLDLWFQLGYETYVTDFIIAELQKGDHPEILSYVDAGLLHVKASESDFISQILELMGEVGNGPSFEDCSVLLLAMKLNAMLLSGDKPLRNAAKVRQIEVHGTLWIFDQLIERDMLKPLVAAQKLEFLLRQNRYLPAYACKSRIALWRKG